MCIFTLFLNNHNYLLIRCVYLWAQLLKPWNQMEYWNSHSLFHIAFYHRKHWKASFKRYFIINNIEKSTLKLNCLELVLCTTCSRCWVLLSFPGNFKISGGTLWVYWGTPEDLGAQLGKKVPSSLSSNLHWWCKIKGR